MSDPRIIAVGLLTARDLELLGQDFTLVYPVDEKPCFEELLRAIDAADREYQTAVGQEADKSGNGSQGEKPTEREASGASNPKPRD